ncbi:hypothetical protein F53441_1798 [Fusarium austroafricanum]|uniref:Uncharacterized protein n=1 Tax=Fusarium austroafricanum TaxID=2364996 RepID=A0A8H4P1U1_9HYPO|nr:hypothetical protein F53441_1798 [Fusarium austroafricanum]
MRDSDLESIIAEEQQMIGSMGESVVKTGEQAKQESATMDVSWQAMGSSHSIAKDDDLYEEIMSQSRGLGEAHQDPWKDLANGPTSVSWPKQDFAETGWVIGGFDTAKHMNGMPLGQGSDGMAWMEQSANLVTRQETISDPANFQSLEHWLFATS